jgi:hypothetical protein
MKLSKTKAIVSDRTSPAVPRRIPITANNLRVLLRPTIPKPTDTVAKSVPP